MPISPNSPEFQTIIALSIALLVFKLLLIIYLTKIKIRKIKEEGVIEFDIILAFDLLMVCLFFSRVCLIYFDFFIKYDEDILFLMPNIIFWKLGQLFAGIGLFFIMLFIIERKVLENKTRGVFSYTFIILHIFILLYPVNSIQDYEFLSVLVVFAYAITLIMPIMLLYIGFKIRGLRKTSWTLAIAAILYMIGTVIVVDFFTSPFEKEFGPQIIILFYSLNLGMKGIAFLLWGYGSTGFVYSGSESKEKKYKKKDYPIVRKIHQESKRRLIKLLSITKEDEITKEEISYLSEHTNCIVCKSKLVRFVNVYICPKCDAHYCENCARNVIDLENSCWVCYEPIDGKRPSKPIKEELEGEEKEEFGKTHETNSKKELD